MTAGAPSPPGARLAAELRQLRQRTGLSLTRLANATTCSRSSWERYLNGKSLPPRSAVKELCHLADEPADHALALLDIARTNRTAKAPSTLETPARQHTTTGTDRPPPPPTGHRRVHVVTALASTCAVVIGTFVLVNLPPARVREAPPSPSPTAATGPLCRRAGCQNKDPITTRCGAEPLTLAEHETATGAPGSRSVTARNAGRVGPGCGVPP
ncbi:helix-turn-helix transcriptional regulator [Streptomyces griseorubiginosus]|uniref:helix-turn-helix domain-containing protein n=1 Tax=Streptomyces griseorubiginosus TaxID=67304 RepID=UPI0033B918FC